MLSIGKMLSIGQMLLIGKMLSIGQMLPIGQMLLIWRMLLILPVSAVGVAPHDSLLLQMENTGIPFVDVVPASSDDPVIEELRKYHVAICAASGMVSFASHLGHFNSSLWLFAEYGIWTSDDDSVP
jgi:hypothetical protein